MPRTAVRATAARSVVALGSSGVAISAIQYLQLMVLARLLAPAHFGVMALAIVALGIALAVADVGLRATLVYRQDATELQLSSLYWTMAGGGILLGLAVWGAAGPLAALFGEPELASALGILAWTVPVAMFGEPFLSLLQRDLRFGRIALVETAAAVASATTGIVLALGGAQLMALVGAHVMAVSIRSVGGALAARSTWWPRLYFRAGDVAPVARFGLFQMGERLLNHWSTNVDYLVIGTFLGAHALGIYRVAYDLVLVPVFKVAPVVSRVAFPVFARRQDDDLALRSGFLDMTRLLAFLLFPALAGGAILAPYLVPLVLGDGWEAAVPLIQVLAVVGAAKSLGNATGSLLLAKGRADLGFYLNLGTALAYTLGFALAVRYGTIGVAITFAALNLLYLFVSRLVLFDLVGLDWGSYLKAVAPSLVAAALMGAGVVAGLRLMPAGVDAIGAVAVGVVLGTTLYAAAHLTFNRPFLVHLRGMARPLFARSDHA